MKKYIITLITGCLALSACEDMYKPKTVGEVDDESMWKVPEMAQGVLMNAYQAIDNRPDHYDGNFLDVATDNAVTVSYNSAIYRLSLGCLTPTNCPIGGWDKAYSQFQNIHLFINKGLGDATRYSTSSTTEDQSIKSRLYAEAIYLRAFWGAFLLQQYGGRTNDGEALGYPIVTEFITEDQAADFSWIKRDTYEDCVAQICADCDLAASGLPTIASDAYVGRATSYMAEFLKARVLFLAANPAYQDASIVKINGMGDYTVLNETAYKAKWERAAKQIWKVMSLTGQTSYTALKRTDLVDMDQNNPVTPSHFLFRYYYQANGLESRQFPPFYFGSAQTQPSQNLVDAYPMKANGYPISMTESGYDAANPYSGRDNRFEMTVYHHDSEFEQSGRASESTKTYLDMVYGGKDSEAFMNGTSRGSRTGYYLHKWLSEKKDMLIPTQSVNALHFYPTMRMAEMFLDLAEALNELAGPEGTVAGIGSAANNQTAYGIIKDIRQKAGGITSDLYIDTVKGSKDTFFDLIMNERRLEFAFEDFRYWDLRRRLLPLSATMQGVTVEKDGAGIKYTVRDLEDRPFDQLKFYYLPIPYAEVQKNPSGMINNIGY